MDSFYIEILGDKNWLVYTPDSETYIGHISENKGVFTLCDIFKLEHTSDSLEGILSKLYESLIPIIMH